MRNPSARRIKHRPRVRGKIDGDRPRCSVPEVAGKPVAERVGFAELDRRLARVELGAAKATTRERELVARVKDAVHVQRRPCGHGERHVQIAALVEVVGRNLLGVSGVDQRGPGNRREERGRLVARAALAGGVRDTVHHEGKIDPTFLEVSRKEVPERRCTGALGRFLQGFARVSRNRHPLHSAPFETLRIDRDWGGRVQNGGANSAAQAEFVVDIEDRIVIECGAGRRS